jgi:hypothetical protein
VDFFRERGVVGFLARFSGPFSVTRIIAHRHCVTLSCVLLLLYFCLALLVAPDSEISVVYPPRD